MSGLAESNYPRSKSRWCRSLRFQCIEPRVCVVPKGQAEGGRGQDRFGHADRWPDSNEHSDDPSHARPRSKGGVDVALEASSISAECERRQGGRRRGVLGSRWQLANLMALSDSLPSTSDLVAYRQAAQDLSVVQAARLLACS